MDTMIKTSHQPSDKGFIKDWKWGTILWTMVLFSERFRIL